MAVRTLANMRTTVTGNCGNHAAVITSELNTILQGVARELTEEHEWAERRREAIVALVAPYTTGTVTVTNGSATVTGASTVWTAAMVGRAITIDGLDTYLRVATRVSNTEITLGDAQLSAVTWPGATASALTYSIFGLDYAIASDIAVVLWGTQEFPLVETSPEWLDAIDPKRTQRRAEPTHYSLTRQRIDGSPNVQTAYIEFWPVVSAATAIRVPYLCVAPALTGETDLPACPSQLIELLGTSRLADYLFSKTGDARWSALSDRYYRRLMGSGSDPGALEKMKEANDARRSLPSMLGRSMRPLGIDHIAAYDTDWP